MVEFKCILCGAPHVSERDPETGTHPWPSTLTPDRVTAAWRCVTCPKSEEKKHA